MGSNAPAKTFGVMQGRLSPPEDGRFQAFPRNGWRAEIARAREAGLDYVEWIFDEYGRDANPILSEEGRGELAALKSRHGIETPALCADWFMEFPFLHCSEATRKEREQQLVALLPIAREIGAQRIVLPLVDNSRMVSDEDQALIVAVLERVLPAAEKYGVELHLEADLTPFDFAAFLARIPHALLKVNWDSGNSSGLGFIAHQEFAAYGERIGSVHLKDRYRKPDGGVETRTLGTGSADFDDVFSSLASIGYAGGLTLQVARGEAGDEVNFIRGQLDFVQARWR
jgi:hexulose-6-phosphate isomerase